MIKKKIASLLVVILAFLLQTTIFQKLALADVVPNLLLVATVSYAYLRGRTSGILIGFLCGLLLDMGYGSVIGLYALILLSIGFVVGFCQKFYFREGLVLPIVLIASSSLVYDIYYYVTEFLVRARLNFSFYFVHKILPKAIYTTLVGIVAYKLIDTLDRKISSRREEESF